MDKKKRVLSTFAGRFFKLREIEIENQNPNSNHGSHK
jgi:hypothetical protein